MGWREACMNTGEKTIEWLYKNQLQVDVDWSVRNERGFTWWPYQHAQRIEITGDVNGPDGATGQCVAIRTEVLRDLDLTDSAAVAINDLVQAGAYTMSGLVYDAATRRLDLCSSVVVHEDIREWMQLIMSLAAVLQIAEAQPMADALVTFCGIGASVAISGHPANGMRTVPDEMAMIGQSVIVPMGREPCAWAAEEFTDVERRYMQKPPALFSMSDSTGVNVEFPYGDFSSLCQVEANTPHVAYGNGLRVTQSFPVSQSSDVEGVRLAFRMNAAELAGTPTGYGFGTYFYRKGTLCFSTFFPNFMHKPALLPNLYFAAAHRAQAVSIALTGKDWTEDSFDIRHSAEGRLFFGPPKTAR
jgi:hypothetical protein